MKWQKGGLKEKFLYDTEYAVIASDSAAFYDDASAFSTVTPDASSEASKNHRESRKRFIEKFHWFKIKEKVN